ncbi:hypothetical protein Pgy4_38141, partial [Pseudomonas savastanoi pv. glycinea str. race 4]
MFIGVVCREKIYASFPASAIHNANTIAPLQDYPAPGDLFRHHFPADGRAG